MNPTYKNRPQKIAIADYDTGIRRRPSFANQNGNQKQAEHIAPKIPPDESKTARMQGTDAAEFTRASELLKSTGTPLLTAVSQYAEAVKILGSDRILEAVKDFARRHSSHRRPRAGRRILAESITIYTPTELRALLAAAPGWFRPALAIQAFAGLRSAEVLRLDWKHVQLDSGHIEIIARRTKVARRLAPIPANLVLWLAAPAKSAGKVFPQPLQDFQEMEANTARAAEIPWKPDALRHSFVSYRMAQTSDVGRVALESGHSPSGIFKHYRALASEMDARQWFSITP